MIFITGTKESCDKYNKDNNTNYERVDNIKDLPRATSKRSILVYILADAKEDLKIDILNRRGVETIYVK